MARSEGEEESFQALSTSSKVLLRKQFLESGMSVGRATLLHGRKSSNGLEVLQDQCQHPQHPVLAVRAR